jgi:hypothetical protein
MNPVIALKVASRIREVGRGTGLYETHKFFKSDGEDRLRLA